MRINQVDHEKNLGFELTPLETQFSFGNSTTRQLREYKTQYYDVFRNNAVKLA